MRLLITILSILLLANTAIAENNIVLKTKKEKISYGIGMDIGKNLKTQNIDINPEILAQGIKDAFSGVKPLLTEEEFVNTMTIFKKEMMAKQREQMKALGEKNKKEGETFLEDNKKKEGVVILPSGLQYKVVKEGKGEIPKLTDTVNVHYRGTLIDGAEFDSSYNRGQPATFEVNGVIAGWKEAIQLMKTGSKWQLFVPSNLAYGEIGTRGKIGPNATLIFDVELLSIK